MPGDRWLRRYVDVYRACLHVAEETEDARALIAAALARATDPLRANPFDEILGRRALAELGDDGLAIADLSRALTLATRTHNVLQEGVVRLALAGRLWAADRAAAEAHLDAAEARFTVARAERWLRRAQQRRGIAA